VAARTYEKVQRQDPVLGPASADAGRLLVDAGTIRFEGKKGTLDITHVRDISLDKGGKLQVTYGDPPGISTVELLDISSGRLARKWKPATAALMNDLRSLVPVEPLSPEQAEAAGRAKQVLSGAQASAGLKSARIKMWIGGLLVVGGGLATIITYSIASSNSFGGTYIVAWGPMVYGAFLLISGIVDHRKFQASTRPSEPVATSTPPPEAGTPVAVPAAQPAPDGRPDVAGMKVSRDVDGLVGALWHDELDVRVRVMDALAELRDPRSVDLLTARLGDGRWDVRWSAAEALGRLGDRRAIEPLRGVLNDENAMVRAVAENSIDRLTGS
jgi:hypothetical protein